MDYKQIHVWVCSVDQPRLPRIHQGSQFQNRRSRFRKDGKILKKWEVKDEVLAALEQSVNKSLLPPTGPEEDDDSSIMENTDVSVFYASRLSPAYSAAKCSFSPTTKSIPLHQLST